ncbi:hypothetical protein [Nocardiopsis oceani]
MSTPREPEPGGGGGGGSRGGEPPDLAEEYGDVFDCGALEVSCHISKWFHGLVVDILEPLFGWVAEKMFTTPAPTEGISGIWDGAVTTVNILYALLVLAVAFVVMAHHSLQSQFGARELLPRLVVGWVAANVSLTVVALAAEVSTAVATAIVASGIDSGVAAQNLREKTIPALSQESTVIVLFLVVFVVLLVLWLVVEIIRIVIVILLMVGGPLMLAFHALPYTNRVAQMWWRALGAVMLVPVAQAIAYVALVRVFFEGDTAAFFGMADVMSGEADLVDLALLLVLVYVQIRIPMWAYKAVWSPPAARVPGAGLAKTAATALALGAITGGAAGTAAAGGARTRRIGHLLRRRPGGSTTQAHTAALPRRARTWRFGSPGTHHGGGPTRTTQPHTPRAGRPTPRPPQGPTPGGNPPAPRPGPRIPVPPHRPGSRDSSPPHQPTTVPTPQRLLGRHRQPHRPGQPPSGRTQPKAAHGRPRQHTSGAHPTPAQTGSGAHGPPSPPRWRSPATWSPRRRSGGTHRRPRPPSQRRWWRR